MSAASQRPKQRARQSAPKHWKQSRRRRMADKPLPKWKVEAIAAATTAHALPWESEGEWAKRVSADVARGIAFANVEPPPDTHLEFIGVYVLESASQRRQYVGYTVNAERRLRQHNGEIKGGADRTKSDRPWRMLAHVSGFDSKVKAERFEYALSFPSRSKVARPLLRHPSVMRPLKRITPAEEKTRIAQLLMRCGKFAAMPLVVTWLCANAEERNLIEFGE